MTTWSVDVDLVVGRHSPAGMSWSTVPVVGLAHPVADGWPGGGLVVAGASYASRSARPEMNAVRLDAGTTVVERGGLGHGIEHLAVDRHGSMWCGYFDEGIYGGVDFPGIGAPGLVRFDDLSAPAWSVDVPAGFEPVVDCCAMNVGRDVWACYNSSFSLVRVRDGTSTFWHNRTGTAPQAPLVDDPRVGLVSAHGDDRHVVVLEEVSATSPWSASA